MNYQEYIKTELLVLIPVMYFIGIWLKKSKLSDKRIPIVLGIIAVVLSAVWVVSTSDISNLKEIASALFTAITQGVLVASAGVYTNEIIVQSKKQE